MPRKTTPEERIAARINRLRARHERMQRERIERADAFYSKRLDRSARQYAQERERRLKAIDDDTRHRRLIIEEEVRNKLEGVAGDKTEEARVNRAKAALERELEREAKRKRRDIEREVKRVHAQRIKEINRGRRQRIADIRRGIREQADFDLRDLKEDEGISLTKLRRIYRIEREVQAEDVATRKPGKAPPRPKPIGDWEEVATPRKKDKLRRIKFENVDLSEVTLDKMPEWLLGEGGAEDEDRQILVDPRETRDFGVGFAGGGGGGETDTDDLDGRLAELEIRYKAIVETTGGAEVYEGVIDRRIHFTRWDIARTLITSLPIKDSKGLVLFISVLDWDSGVASDFTWTHDDYQALPVA